MFFPFLLGVVMGMCGFALLIVKDPGLGKRKFRAPWARRLGIFLLAFFPVILLERYLLREFDPDEEADPLLVHLILTGIWALIGLVLMVVALRKVPKAQAAVGKAPGAKPIPKLTSVPEPERQPSSTKGPPRKKPVAQDQPPPPNPFDFHEG